MSGESVMKKWMVLLLAAMLAAIPVQGEESVSELLDPVDLSNTADWVECGDYIYDPNEAGDAVVTGYMGGGGDVVIPGTLNGCTVTGIASYAFAATADQDYANSVTAITVPDSVQAIGFGAFSGENLTNIYVDEGNTNYRDVDGILFTADGKVLHQYPSGRTDSTYTIPETVQTIEMCAFHHANALTSMEIPATVEGIGHSAFYACENLETVRIGSGTVVIDSCVFIGEKLTDIYVDDANEYYCDVDGILFSKDMTELIQYPAGRTDTFYSIPDTVMSVANSAFRNCGSLTEIEIPRSVSVIDDDAFRGCIGLTEIVLPRGLEFIGHRAFADCCQLSKAYFKSSAMLSNMCGDDIFYKCNDGLILYFNLANAADWEFPEWKAQDGTIYNTQIFTPYLWEYRISEDGTAVITAWNGSSSDVVVPGVIDGYSVTAIGNHAFDSETVIASITIPETVEMIGDRAFWGCTAIGEITIPAAVTRLGTCAFYNCTALNRIIFRGDVPAEWGKEAVAECAEDLLIGYPVGNTSGWTCPQWTSEDGKIYRTAPWGKNGRIGDVNADHAVDAVDGEILSRYFAGDDVSAELIWLDEADIDRNGKLNRRDCMILARYLAAWENISLDWRETE